MNDPSKERIAAALARVKELEESHRRCVAELCATHKALQAAESALATARELFHRWKEDRMQEDQQLENDTDAWLASHPSPAPVAAKHLEPRD